MLSEDVAFDAKDRAVGLLGSVLDGAGGVAVSNDLHARMVCLGDVIVCFDLGGVLIRICHSWEEACRRANLAPPRS
ncbi:MAG TPA: hypothetical protein VFU90_13480, partial [Candidatus Tumulicola sp.]|nr:hypothetical protein [Candidatus Tumulicola sp.]